MSLKGRIQLLKDKFYAWANPDDYPESITNEDLERALDSYEIDDKGFIRDDIEDDGHITRRDYGYHRNYLGIPNYKLKVILLLGIVVVFALISIWFLKPGRIPYQKP